MKGYTYFFKVLLILLSTSVVAQNTDRKYVSHTYQNGQLEVVTDDGSYVFKVYSGEIIETTFVPEGEDLNSKSHAVVMQPQDALPTFYFNIDEDIDYGATDGISVTISPQPFQITYKYNGKKLISEKRGYFQDSLKKIEFNLKEDEVLYGGGARALGMNRRGYRLQLYNRAHYGYETHSELMNYTMPIVLSSHKYMVHFDNAPIGYLDLDSKSDNTLTYETISGRITYQVITGTDWSSMMNAYTNLTGKQPMPPRWALGNFSSRFGYHSQTETEATIDKFIAEDIPVDAIVLDLYWFGKDIKGTMGNLEIFRDSFPDFEGMVKRLNNKGVKTVAITEPFILTTSNRWQEAVSKDILAKDSVGNPARYDFYFGNTGIIDIYKPESEQWFWDIYKDIANTGVAGVWGDLGEPEVHPGWVQHATGSADEVHNIYGHDWARLVHEGYKRDFPDTRPFILMRAGYSGSQRYGMIPWSGDVNRTWGGLQSQPEIALQMGMQGLAYMHSDLGGFAGANLDDELYVRWLQYGVFNPIFRPHAQEDVPSEPIFRSKKAKDLAREAIKLRYRLLPYNYSLVYQNNRYGKPLMRPLFFEEPDNETLYDYSKAYLWGDHFLISPVLEAGKKEQDMYFPKDNLWFNFYTDKKIKGGTTKTVVLNENTIPTYVRGGAFIPMSKDIQNTAAYSSKVIELHYYHDASILESKGELYLDDGMLANSIKKERYELMQFTAEAKQKRLNIQFKSKTGINYDVSYKDITLVIHNITSNTKRIKFKGKTLQGNWDKAKQTLTINVPLRVVKKPSKLKIKFK